MVWLLLPGLQALPEPYLSSLSPGTFLHLWARFPLQDRKSEVWFYSTGAQTWLPEESPERLYKKHQCLDPTHLRFDLLGIECDLKYDVFKSLSGDSHMWFQNRCSMVPNPGVLPTPFPPVSLDYSYDFCQSGSSKCPRTTVSSVSVSMGCNCPCNC